jgi:hypothetical protein
VDLARVPWHRHGLAVGRDVLLAPSAGQRRTSFRPGSREGYSAYSEACLGEDLWDSTVAALGGGGGARRSRRRFNSAPLIKFARSMFTAVLSMLLSPCARYFSSTSCSELIRAMTGCEDEKAVRVSCRAADSVDFTHATCIGGLLPANSHPVVLQSWPRKAICLSRSATCIAVICTRNVEVRNHGSHCLPQTGEPQSSKWTLREIPNPVVNSPTKSIGGVGS